MENNINEIEKTVNSTDFIENFENTKSRLLLNLERINAYSSENKINPLLLELNFIESLLKLFSKSLEDSEISDTNEKMLFNLLSILKLINFSNGFSDAKILDDFLNLLINGIKEKSHYKEFFINSLKNLCDYIYNKEKFENLLLKKINFEFIDSLFLSSENYLDDNEVGREINNTLCGLCIYSENLAKYIVEKGGLANIIEELKFSVKQDDEKSEIIKFSGLKFIDTLVKENSNMEKFIKLRGMELILKFINRFIEDESIEQDINNNPVIQGGMENNFLCLNDYSTNTTIVINDRKNNENLEVNSLKYNKENLDEKYFGNNNQEESTAENNNKKSIKINEFVNGLKNIFIKKTSNYIEQQVVVQKTQNKQKNKYSPYLVYCINIIDTNFNQGRNEFNNPKLFKNIISLIR